MVFNYLLRGLSGGGTEVNDTSTKEDLSSRQGFATVHTKTLEFPGLKPDSIPGYPGFLAFEGKGDVKNGVYSTQDPRAPGFTIVSMYGAMKSRKLEGIATKDRSLFRPKNGGFEVIRLLPGETVSHNERIFAGTSADKEKFVKLSATAHKNGELELTVLKETDFPGDSRG